MLPSTFTCTTDIGVPTVVALSMAHPEMLAIPDSTDPATGESMATSGGSLDVVTDTLEEPTSGKGSLSVADTVMVWGPEASPVVFSWKLYPTLGQFGRP